MPDWASKLAMILLRGSVIGLGERSVTSVCACSETDEPARSSTKIRMKQKYRNLLTGSLLFETASNANERFRYEKENASALVTEGACPRPEWYLRAWFRPQE